MKTQTFIIISPPAPIITYAYSLKQRIKGLLRSGFESEFSKAHISFFVYTDTHQDSVLYNINDTLLHFKPFNVHINGFNILHHGSKRTICLNIENKSFIQDVYYSLTGREIQPHITIAKNLSKEDFDKVWPSINTITYSNHFCCDHLTVLKGKPGSWDYYMDLPFSS